MATFIVLGQFTEQGVKNVKETTKRAEALKELAKKVGATVKAVYWTIGPYDVATILEAPDDETAAALLFSIGRLGNVRTISLRAFSAEEIGPILGRVV